MQYVQNACMWYMCVHICTCLGMSWWVSVCLCEIPNLKHMLVTAGQVSLTRPSNVSPHSQLRANFDNLSRKGSAGVRNACLSFAKTAFHLSVSPRVCLCTSEREANWNWAWPPDASRLWAITLTLDTHSHMCTHTHTHTESCACSHSHAHTHTHIHTSSHTDVFFPSTPPSPSFFFSLTSPFQAKQNGCKHRVPVGGVECLRGLHRLWSSLTDSPPCVWQFLGFCRLVALWWSLRGPHNFP